MNLLEKSFNYYKKHQAELVKKYEGKFVVIVGEKVVGSYDTEGDAIKEALKTYSLGDFLVQLVEGGEENITQTFHSRVMVHGG